MTHSTKASTNNKFEYLLRDLNEDLLEDLNDADLKQISGGQSIEASSYSSGGSSSISISSSSSSSSGSFAEGFVSGGSGKVTVNEETLFDGELPPGGFSFSRFF